MGQEDGLMENNLAEAEAAVDELEDKWCCMYKVMSLQEDFVNEKPQLQHDLEARGHVCLFLPKFHCELNPIKLVWGYAKYRELLFSLNHLIIYGINVTGYRNASDGKFSTTKVLVPQCLDMCKMITMCCFFRKVWRYMDAYWCVASVVIQFC
jgi:hypothetical protein